MPCFIHDCYKKQTKNILLDDLLNVKGNGALIAESMTHTPEGPKRHSEAVFAFLHEFYNRQKIFGPAKKMVS